MSRNVLLVASVAKHLQLFHLPYLDYLRRQGYEVHVACSLDVPRQVFADRGVIVHELPATRKAWQPGRLLQAALRLRTLLQQHEFCLIHVHTPIISFLTRLVARFTGGTPVLYTAHGFHFYEGAPLVNWLVYFPAEYLARFWTDGLVVINEEDYRQAVTRLHYRPGKDLYRVAGVGVDLAAPRGTAAPSLDRLAPGEGCALACVAELIPRKNHRFLFDAWELLQAQGVQARLLLLGDGEGQARLQAEVRRRGLEGIHFLGYRSDVAGIVAQCDAVVLVSRQEGLPRAVLEGMALGKAVVASDIRGNRELVAQGRTGFLVPLDEPQALAEALRRLCEEPALRQRLGAEGRRAVEAYALPQVLKQMAAVYARYLPPRQEAAPGASRGAKEASR